MSSLLAALDGGWTAVLIAKAHSRCVLRTMLGASSRRATIRDAAEAELAKHTPVRDES